MSFSSLTFIVFVIIVFIGYYILPKKTQWLWLLIVSYIFYTWSTPYFVLFLVFSTMTTWAFSLYIGDVNEKQIKYLNSEPGKLLSRDDKKKYKMSQTNKKKLILLVCLICNIGILVFLKYTNLFIYMIDRLGATVSPLDWLILPLGISFYTFQSIGYSIDIYRDVARPQKNLLRYALYVSYFPQICQGPIGQYNELSVQLYKSHDFDYSSFVHGIERVLFGLFKKLVIANRIAIFVNPIYQDIYSYSGLVIAFATFMYAFQLYADFSGYMDIAIGVSECLGIKLSENFQTPYFSRSIAEFWRRWHITLGTWFRNYLYYPILRSGWCSKIGKYFSDKGYKKFAQILTTVIGLAITWVLIGMWHGASFHYVVYGIYHGFFIVTSVIFSDLYIKTKTKLHINENNKIWNIFQILRTFIIVCFSYIFFKSTSMSVVFTIIKKIIVDIFIVPVQFINLKSTVLTYLSMFQLEVLLLGILIIFVVEIVDLKHSFHDWFRRQNIVIKWSFLYIIIVSIIFLGCYGYNDASTFIYFQF